jgi:hypothetical protein
MTAVAASLAGSGVLTAELDTFTLPELRMVIPDNVIQRGPTAVTIILTEAAPLEDVTFDIDGTDVMTVATNTEGEIVALSLPVDEALSTSGTHTITATQDGSISATATFSIVHDFSPVARAIIPDVDPIEIPGAITHGTRHWVLQDLSVGGLGSYVLPVSPSSWVAPHVRRQLDAVHTTARNGIFHVTESGDTAIEFSFRGYCPTQEMHDKLLAYGLLARRFYLIDHRNRAWVVAFTNVDLTARRRQRGLDGSVTDWGHDYTVSALAYSQNWKVPK